MGGGPGQRLDELSILRSARNFTCGRQGLAAFGMTRASFPNLVFRCGRSDRSEEGGFFLREYCAEIEDYAVVFDAGDYWN